MNQLEALPFYTTLEICNSGFGELQLQLIKPASNNVSVSGKKQEACFCLHVC